MYKKYKGKVEFYLVYIREAHPTDGWKSRKNTRNGINVKQPTNLKERAKVAETCVASLKVDFPCALDDMKGSAQKAYSAWPDRIYVVDINGKIAMKGGPGPQGFDPEAAEKSVKALLANKGKIKK
jgi:hypothetical protein